MRITEIDLKTTETQPREAASNGRSEHKDATQRPRKRGAHTIAAAKPTRRRQTRRRAAHAGEHAATAGSRSAA
jgi:hypothetical protein